MIKIFTAFIALFVAFTTNARAAGWLDTNFIPATISGSTRQVINSYGDNLGRGGAVYGLHRLGDGRFYVSGTFTNVGGHLRIGIARMMPNGDVDTGFVANRFSGSTNLYIKLVAGAGDVIYAEASYFIGTSFGSPQFTNFIVRIESNGTISDLLYGGTNTVLAVQDDGKILVSSGPTRTAAPQTIRRLNPDGTADSAFRQIRLQYSGDSSNPRGPRATLLPDGKAIIACKVINAVFEELPEGGFRPYVSTFTDAVRVGSDGKWDSQFRLGTSVAQVLLRSNGQLLLRSDGIIMTGFSDQSFRSMVSMTLFGISNPAFGKSELSAPNGPDLLVESADGYLYRRGYGTNSAGFFYRYSADGIRDTNFSISIETTNASGTEIRAAIPSPDGAVLVGGIFSVVDGIERKGLFRVKPPDWSGPVSIEFAMTNGIIAESDSPTPVILRRTGDTNASLGVTVSQIGGSAESSDLATSSWNVVFQPGEVTKTFSLHAVYDGLFESGETLTLGLSNPTGGASLGGQTTSRWLVYNRDTKIVPVLPLEQVVPSGREVLLPLDGSVLEPEFCYASVQIVGLDRPAELDVLATNYSGLSTSFLNPNVRIPIRSNSDGFGPRRLRITYSFGPRETSDLNVVGGNVERIVVVDDRQPSSESLQGLLVRSPRIGHVAGVGSAVYGYVTNFGATSNLGVAFFAGNGRRVRSWPNTSVQSGQISAALAQPDSRLVLGGSFTDISGQAKAYLARVLQDGSLDPTFANGTPNGAVESLFTLSSGRILVSGSFTQLGGLSRNGVAVIDANGQLDAGFDPAAAVGALRVVKVLPDGTFYANRGSTNLLRFSAAGTLDTGFLVTLNSVVQSLEVEADGSILISGGFNRVNGQVRTTISRLNSDGSLAGFQAGYPVFDGLVTKLILQQDGKILVCGYFSTINGQRRARVARLAPDGALDAGFVPAAEPNNVVSSMDLLPDGSLLIGGDFDRVGNRFRLGLARLSDSGMVLHDAPQLTFLRSIPEPVLRFDTEPGQQYFLQKSSNLSEWAPAGEITAAGFSTTFTNSAPRPFSGEFYQILANP